MSSSILDPRRRRQLEEIARLEASHDVASPALSRRLRELAAGPGEPEPIAARRELAVELDRLRACSQAQWAQLKRSVLALRRARAAHALDNTAAARRRVAALRRDAEWQIDIFAETRRRIGRVEDALAREANATDRRAAAYR